MDNKIMQEYFVKISQKKDDLIKAQILHNEKDIKQICDEIDLLMDLCFNGENGNAFLMREITV